ncbi:TetR/AcrR family transcriptional regulator [Jongsikchunia kroppenstedtii]|uniref:TetR/AcrR family transcriptional regulator n=1 Tax=Jongsikchunia kroppenstedtii TaxID=1121721 RepID=UPI000379E5E0|nr:TetR/AcrR family transcriptional regulator [Jongsikchunia kroppenstedtii]
MRADTVVIVKAKTRDELQAETRELIFAAAETVFLDRGYNATTVAQIAAEAGRTHGSIYGNFAGKEDLCRQLVLKHFGEVMTALARDVSAAADDDAKQTAIQRHWDKVLDRPEWIRLTSDFVLATRETSIASNKQTIDYFRGAVAALIVSESHTSGSAALEPRELDAMVAALFGSGIGLAIGFSLGAIDRDIATAGFLGTMERWLRLSTDRDAQ